MSAITPSLHVENFPIDSLIPYPRNARTHSKKQLRQIADSIKEFGFTNPVLIDAKRTIIAGHGRVLAAKMLAISEVPTIRLEHLTEEQIRAYIIADNRLAEKAGWDNAILSIELQHLSLNTDFDVTLTGFEMAEIDLIISDAAESTHEKEAPVPALSPIVVSRLGQLWHLGDHRLYCGDALEPRSYDTLFAGAKAQMVFSDPPFNVPIRGHVSGLGKIQHEEFAMASGEMSDAEFQDFLRRVMRQLTQHAEDGSIHYMCMDWRHIADLVTVGGEVYTELKNICVWNKDNAGMGALYRSKHEFVGVFKHGTAPHINNVLLGVHGRYRTNVWDYPGQNSLHADRGSELAMHPTVKPVALVADAILDCSHRGKIIADPFGGSGTTLIAAEKTGRMARLMELDQRYVDVTIRRWQELTDREATDAESGKTFNALAAQAMEAAHE